MFSEEPKIK